VFVTVGVAVGPVGRALIGTASCENARFPDHVQLIVAVPFERLLPEPLTLLPPLFVC
jgi:hypothetical protein